MSRSTTNVRVTLISVAVLTDTSIITAVVRGRTGALWPENWTLVSNAYGEDLLVSPSGQTHEVDPAPVHPSSYDELAVIIASAVV